MSFTLHNIFDVDLCCSLYQYVHTSYGCIIFHQIDTLHYAYLFPNWWTFGWVLISLGEIIRSGSVEPYGSLIQPELLKWSLSVCKMKLNSGTRAVSTLQPGGTGRHLICSHAGCFHPRDPRQSHTAHCPWKIASLPWVPKDSGAQSTQTRSAWPSRCVISSSEGQVRFWHAVIGMKTRGSIRCLELSSGGWSRSWWVSPSWLSAIPREESEWTTLCVIIWVGFSLSIA